MEITIFTTFLIIISFVFLNFVLSCGIYISTKKKLYSRLSIFWLSLIVNFFIQGSAQSSEFLIVLAFSFSLVPLNLLSYASIFLVEKEYPWKAMVGIGAAGLVASLMLSTSSSPPFVLKALPLAFATAAPLVYLSWTFLVSMRDRATFMMKVEAVVVILISIHCFNFAFFRMDPNAQLWGWLVSYGTFQSLTAIIPVLSLEFYHKKESERLKLEIERKTKDLQTANESLSLALGEKTFLMRALVHDVSNPLMVIIARSELLSLKKESSEFIQLIQKMAKRIENLITQFRRLEKINESPDQFFFGMEANFFEALDETLSMLSERANEKGIGFTIDCDRSVNIYVPLEKDLLISSVLANFVSNAIKFSSKGQNVELSVKQLEGVVQFRARNYGTGISQDKILSLFSFSTNESGKGTDGEVGTGFGIPIAKKILDGIKGRLTITSNTNLAHGPAYTEVEVLLPLITVEEVPSQSVLELAS